MAIYPDKLPLEKQPRQLTKNIEAIPWQIFIKRLWQALSD
jgi:hypothetical protein